MSKPYRGPRRYKLSCTESASEAAAPASDSGGPPPAATESPRLVTRGESHADKPANAFVDWLSFTVKEDCFSNPTDWGEALANYLQVPQLAIGGRERGVAGFRFSAPLKLACEREQVNVGKVAWGGESQNGRLYVSIAGALCARVQDWVPLQLVLTLCDARITRIDLAHDDLGGEHSVDRAVAYYDDGGFNAGGRRPTCEMQGDWKQVSGRGRTFYVGRKTHGKLLRVYEKGKQLGDASSPWVRWEVEFHNRDRHLPYEMLTQPGPYLAGAFPALGFVSWAPIRIRTQRKAVKATLEHLIAHLSKSYGKTINALRLQGFDADDIMAQVVRPGLPQRLKQPMAACAPGTKVYGDLDGEP